MTEAVSNPLLPILGNWPPLYGLDVHIRRAMTWFFGMNSCGKTSNYRSCWPIKQGLRLSSYAKFESFERNMPSVFTSSCGGGSLPQLPF